MRPTAFLCALFLALALFACGGASKGATKPLLAVGSEAPALVRVDHTGKVVALRGDTPSLVYFYPKDGTPGCTKEACAFRDAWQRYEGAGELLPRLCADACSATPNRAARAGKAAAARGRADWAVS